MPRISILTSLYRSEPYIQELYDRSCATLKGITDDYEFVFVDDGSPDAGNAVVQGLIEQDKRVRLVELSRNFGQHRALMAGLQHVSGELVFMIDSDLEEDPELLETFYKKMQADQDIDVVYGVMESRKGGILERVPGTAFYWLMNFMSEIPIPTDVMGARLMKRDFVNTLLEFPEAQPFLGGIMTLAGYRQEGVQCAKGSKGLTTYNLRRKIGLALNALLSYSDKPLAWIAGAGFLVTGVTLVGILVLLVRGADDAGVAWILASIWFLGGIILSSVGVVGVYVGRAFGQVKRRPNAIVRRIHN